jgi:ABC-type sugar transport system substrate-binding protein
MRSRRQFLGLVALAAAAASCRKATPAGGGATPKALRIAVIPKGTTHEFWKSVHAGAVKAARELGVEIAWKGPLKEDDLKSQIDLVQSFVAQRISGIVLAPLDLKAAEPGQEPVRSASRWCHRLGSEIERYGSHSDERQQRRRAHRGTTHSGALAGVGALSCDR